MASKQTNVSQTAGPPRPKRHWGFAAIVACLALSVMIIPALANVSAAPTGAVLQENGTPPWIPTIPTIPTEQISSYAKITIVKDAQPNTDTNFEFYGAFGLHFALDDPNSDDGDIYPTSLTVYVPPAQLPGSYNFSEVAQTGWVLTSIDCDQPGKVTKDMSNNSVSISVAAGDHITCTFVNVSNVNPPTSTATNTAVPPTDTATNTPVPPTATATLVPPTDTATNTPVPPTNTATNTAVPPTNTETGTPIVPLGTATNTPVGPTNTATKTPVPPTNTATKTPVPPTNTATKTPVPPTNTSTNTPVPPTNTATNTPVPPTNTPTKTPVPPTNTPTHTPTKTPVPVPTLPTPQPGKALIVIKKDAQPNSIQNFRFDGAFGGFILDDSAPDDGDQYQNTIMYNVVAGTYNFSERTPTEWYLAAINCEGGSTTVNMAQHSVSIKPNSGETIICTFVNQRRVQMQIRKYNDKNENGSYQNNEAYLPDWSIELYTIDNAWITNRMTDKDGSVFYSLRRPGGYKICETPKNGWYNTSPGVDDPSLHLPCYAVVIPPGQGVSMLFGNHNGSKPGNGGSNPGMTDGEIIFYTLPDIDDPNTYDPEVNQDRTPLYLPVLRR